MEKLFDVCVVGAGLWGSAAARHLSEDKNIRVCLLGPEEPQREDYLEADVLGSHYDEGRITRETDADPIWATLAKRSIARYRSLEEKTGIAFFSEVGCLTVGPIGSEYLRSVERISQEQNVAIQRCNKQELQTKFPYLKRDPKKGYLLTKFKSGHISPRRMIAAQKTAAHLQGCEIVHDVALAVRQTCEDGHDVVCISTRHSGIISAKRVLLCPGAFVNFHQLLPEDRKLDFKVESETVVKAEVTGKELARLKNMPVMTMFAGVLPDVEGCYLLPPIQYPNGKFYLKIGHHKSFNRHLKSLDEVKRWFGPSEERADIGRYLLQLLHHALDFEETSVEFDSAVTTKTPTGYPYCGMVSPNIGVLTCGNGRGAKSSDEIGRMGAKLITRGGWDHDLPEETFRPRFSSHCTHMSNL